MPISPADAPVQEAQRLAEELLTGLGDRLRHVRAVAMRAVMAAPAVPGIERPVLVAAAWLHDIGYAAPLRRVGFHPLDGAWFLQEQGWPDLIVGLVAHHSGARFIAEVRGLSAIMAPFAESRYVEGPSPMPWPSRIIRRPGQMGPSSTSSTGWPTCCAATARTAPTRGATVCAPPPCAPQCHGRRRGWRPPTGLR